MIELEEKTSDPWRVFVEDGFDHEVKAIRELDDTESLPWVTSEVPFYAFAQAKTVAGNYTSHVALSLDQLYRDSVSVIDRHGSISP
jgi:hypothetical protein